MAKRAKSRRKVLKETVIVVGTGRVGLPLCLFIADKGYQVFGIDIDQEKINQIGKGQMPFMEQGAPQLLKKYLGKTLFFSTDFSNIARAKVIILTLGTPVDENMNPSLVQIDQALERAKTYFVKEQLLILRSTVSPGTTDYVRSYLNDLGKIKVGTNFYLAFCPERIAEGRSLDELTQIPQIV